MDEIYRDNNDLISSFTEKERQVNEENIANRAANQQKRGSRNSQGSKGALKNQGSKESNPFNSQNQKSPISNNKSKDFASPASYKKLLKDSGSGVQEQTEPGQTEKSKQQPLKFLHLHLKQHMENHGLLQKVQKGQEKLVNIFEDSFDQIQMALTPSEASNILKEAQQVNDAKVDAKTKKELEQLEGFIVSVMRNFFLDLSVDQIEVLCTNFAKRFIEDNIEDTAKQPLKQRSTSQDPVAIKVEKKPQIQHFSPKRQNRKTRMNNKNLYQSEGFPFEGQTSQSVKPSTEQNNLPEKQPTENMPEALLERSMPSNFDMQKNQQFQKMLNQEDHVSKNFQSDCGDIPQIQESAMNTNLQQQKRKVPPLFKKQLKVKQDPMKMRIESITERYMNNNQPRYMSPTIVAKQKFELKKNNQLDQADKPSYDQQLRKPDNTSYSPERHLQQIRQAWRPQSGKVNFEAIKPAPKLQKCLTYRKSESPFGKDPKKQQQFFNRMHQESYKKEKGRYDLYIKGIKEELNQCTFVPNHQRVLSRASGGIKIFQDREDISEIEQRDEVSYLANMNSQLQVGNLDRQGMSNSRRGTQPLLVSTTPEINEVQPQFPRRQSEQQFTPKNSSAARLFGKNQSVHNTMNRYGDDDVTNDLGTKMSSVEKLRPKKELFEYLATEGQKKTKIEVLEQQKVIKELDTCTFKPKIIKNYKPKQVEDQVTKTQESDDEANKNLPVFEKLNKFAREKDMKLRDYQEAQQWRELKDCTFKPQINMKKKDAFHQKRKSNSVMAILSRNVEEPDEKLDTYYKKLNEAYPQASLMNNVKSERSDLSPTKNTISRHDLLYNAKQVYNERQQIKKEELMKERNKHNTFQPNLYKSKVSPNRNMNYQVYQKHPAKNKPDSNGGKSNTDRDQQPSEENRKNYETVPRQHSYKQDDPQTEAAIENDQVDQKEQDQFYNTNIGNLDKPLARPKKTYWSTTVSRANKNKQNDGNSPHFEKSMERNGLEDNKQSTSSPKRGQTQRSSPQRISPRRGQQQRSSPQRVSPKRASPARNLGVQSQLLNTNTNDKEAYAMPQLSEKESNEPQMSSNQSAATKSIQRKSKKERQKRSEQQFEQ